MNIPPSRATFSRSMSPTIVMRARTILILPFAFGLVACGKSAAPPATPTTPTSATAPTVASAKPQKKLTIPTAKNGVDGSTDVPRIKVDDEHVSVDDVKVADVATLDVDGRTHRIDDEFNALKNTREAWRSAHPGKPLPGIALFDFDRATSAAVVKSVLHTAGYAAYPLASLEVQTPSGGLAQIWVDVPIPRKGESSAPIEMAAPFWVEVTSTTIAVEWHDGEKTDHAAASSPEDLTAQLRALTARHPPPNSKPVHASLFVANDISYERIVAILDAMSAKPAFDITFCASEKPEP